MERSEVSAPAGRLTARGTRPARLGPAAWAARHGIYYGWVVVAATFLIVITAAGTSATAGVLIRPLEAEFRWSRGDISLALSVFLLMYGIAGPISGRIADRFGIRRGWRSASSPSPAPASR